LNSTIDVSILGIVVWFSRRGQCTDDGLDFGRDRSLYVSRGESTLLSQRDIGYVFSKSMGQELWHSPFSSNVPSGT